MPEPIVTLNEEGLRSDLRELVRKTVEDTLNGLLEAEADELVGAAEGFTESSECWREFLSRLRSRGPHGVRMVVGDKASGMVGSIAEAFPDAAHRRRTVHFYRNVPARVPKPGRAAVAAMLKAIHAMESREAAEAKALAVAEELEGMRLGEAARVVREGYAETLAYTAFPREHWRRIRTNNAIERLNREIRRRTRVVGHLPGREVGAHARHREAQVRRGERVGISPLPGRDAAGGVAVPDGGPMGCWKARKNLDGTHRRRRAVPGARNGGTI